MKFGLNLDHPTYTPDELEKAGVGFARGAQAGHKYWRRVRTMSQGKLRWKYYYDNEEGRKQFLESQARKIKRKKKQVKKLQGKAPQAPVEEHEGGLRSEFKGDHPELRAARTELKDLTVDLVTEFLAWDKPPEIVLSPVAQSVFKDAVEEHYADLGGEPDELYGQKIHALRILDLGFRQIPSNIRKHFSGSISELLVTTKDEDAYLRRGSASAYCMAGGWGTQGSKIVLGLDLTGADGSWSGKTPGKGVKQPAWGGSRIAPRGEHLPQFDAGTSSVDILVHEMAHAIHNKMGARGPNDMGPDYDGPLWKDWVSFFEKNLVGKGKEPGITAYAEITQKGRDVHMKERFAESFSCSILYPKQMSVSCPKTYEWMRQFIGADEMFPLTTDKVGIEKLKAELDTARSPADKAAVQKRLDKLDGLDEMDFEDERLAWFAGKEVKPVAKLIQAVPRPPQTSETQYVADPPDEDKIGRQTKRLHDRFFEMSYRGRTIYFRYGKQSVDGDMGKPNWDPSDPSQSSNNAVIRAEDIKEVFDENRQPLDRDLIYWHLMQDQFDDPKAKIAQVTVKGKKLDVTLQDILDLPTGLKSKKSGSKVSAAKAAKVQALVDKMGPKFLLRDTTTAGQALLEKALEKGVVAIKSGKAWTLKKPERKATADELAKMEAAYNDANGKPPKPALMRPHELTCREFRQRSGTFSYDRWDTAGESEMRAWQRAQTDEQKRLALTKLRKKQPGIKIKMARNAKGHFTRADVVTAVNHVTGKVEPIFDSKRFVNDNPDGTTTTIDCHRDPRGTGFRVSDPMWSALLTPYGESINSADDLRRFCKKAAAEKRTTWISVRTDRERIQKANGKWKMGKKGDCEHVYHMQVEYDGSGQPKIMGKEWASRLGKDEPRIDDLLKDDPIFAFREGARAVIGAQQITLNPPAKPPKGALPTKGSRVLIDATAKTDPVIEDKTVVARLERIIMGKKAGEAPPKPGWDRMPKDLAGNYIPNLTPSHPVPDGQKLTKAEKGYIKQGLLPEWYNGGDVYREWFNAHFVPAMAAYRSTYKSEKAKAYPTAYLFKGEVGGGTPGRTFIRYGEDAVRSSTSWPKGSHTPEALENEVLVYMHHDVDPRTGATMHKSLRVKLPKNGRVSADSILAIQGAVAADQGPELVPGLRGEITAVEVPADRFPELRKMLGGLSLTGEVDTYLKQRIDHLVDAEKSMSADAHEMSLAEIDPANLADNWGAGLNKRLPSGEEFTLGGHQQKLLQKMIDNDGRVLAAHYMGTGKTVSAIVAAKMMMERPARAKLSSAEKAKMTAEDIKDWYENNPFDNTRRNPGNPKRVLVVAPLNTVEQWRKACADFDEGAQVVGRGSGDISADEFLAMKDSSRGDLVVVGPEYFTKHAAKLKQCGFDGLIVDEVHMGIKNETAERNRVVREWNDDMKMLMLLTGTPMTTSPTDFVEYVRLLSKGKEWPDMTSKKFIDEYLEETPVPGQLGESGKGAKLSVKAEKMGELAAILAKWMDIALPKDVRGKVLPGVRTEESKFAEMKGIQETLFNLYMASLGSDTGGAGLDPEEIDRISDEETRKLTKAAKAITNCIGYKAGNPEKFIRVTTVTFNKSGGESNSRVDFTTFRPSELMDKSRGTAKGKFKRIEEIGPEQAAVYDLYCQEVLGQPYAELAGKWIGTGMPGYKGTGKPTAAQTKVALKRMVDAGWDAPLGKKIENPDAGELGVRFRGHGINWLDEINERIRRSSGSAQKALLGQRAARVDEIDRALHFQRALRTELQLEPPDGDWEEGLQNVCNRLGISLEEGRALLQIHPSPTIIEQSWSADHSGDPVQLTTDDNWISDPKGSQHVVFMPKDWDEKNHRPKDLSKEGFAAVRSGALVQLSASAMKAAGIVPPGVPRGLQPEEREAAKEARKNWVPPQFRYDPDIAAPVGQAGVRVLGTGEVLIVKEKDVSALVKSIFDPGMRAERNKFDIACTHQNAKADELEDHVTRFYSQGGKAGPDGARQLVMFGNSILDSCRTMEAKMRQMGFRDVNEVLEGSPHYDPEDKTTKNGSPNDKYFVTYIGATYTGDRELNVAIFQKVKDALQRDSEVSLFVHKCTEPRPASTWKDAKGVFGDKGKEYESNWMLYPGDRKPPDDVALSQWTAEQRSQIFAQFKIEAPESFVLVSKGDGTTEKRAFNGTKRSAAILSRIAKIGDPNKMADDDQKGAKRELQSLKEEYTALAKQGATDTPVLSSKQTTVFNNCEVIVCSDAAQVGMNLGNATEMLKYDTLASPMAEDQRTTRCARMLPAAVKGKLLGRAIMSQKKNHKGESVWETDDQNQPKLDENGKKIPFMVQEYDDKGRPKYDGSGPFSKIRNMEAAIFEAGPRDRPVGHIGKLTLNGPIAGREGEQLKSMQFEGALSLIRTRCLEVSEDYRTRLCPGAPPSSESRSQIRRLAAEWTLLANKCATAATLGANTQYQLLNELNKRKIPGGTGTVISIPQGEMVDLAEKIESGTYASLARGGPMHCVNAESAVRDALDGKAVTVGDTIYQLSEAERKAVMDAGFVQHDPATGTGSHDAAAVYLAIRADEIFTWMEDKRDEVEQAMKAGPMGGIVSNDDVQNRLIDMLTPEDRAVLKTKKYLVNVRVLGTSGNVGQVHVHHPKKVDGEKPDPQRVFTGYEKEHPVATERRTRAMGRSRKISFEQIIRNVQEGTDFSVAGHFEQVDSLSLSKASSTVITKAIRLVFDFARKLMKGDDDATQQTV
jgi:hypothetical protein